MESIKIYSTSSYWPHFLKSPVFYKIENVNEDSFCARFPEFPRRDDDEQSLYVTAKNKKP